MLEFLKALNEAMDVFPWRGLALAGGLIWLAIGLYRMHRGSSKFAIDDLFLDQRERADLYKLVVVVMAALTVYTVLKLLEGNKPVETLLLGALGIFIGGRAFTAAFAPRDPPPPPGEETSKQEVKREDAAIARQEDGK